MQFVKCSRHWLKKGLAVAATGQLVMIANEQHLAAARQEMQ